MITLSDEEARKVEHALDLAIGGFHLIKFSDVPDLMEQMGKLMDAALCIQFKLDPSFAEDIAKREAEFDADYARRSERKVLKLSDYRR